MNKRDYCYECKKEVKTKVIEENITEIMKGQRLNYSIKKRVCEVCGNEVYDEELLNTALMKPYALYLETQNMNITSFKEIRENLNLTQEQFAKTLGWSRKSIVRYENNQIFPQNEYFNTYKRLNSNNEYIFEILELNKNNLDQQEYNTIKDRIAITQKSVFKKLKNTILIILDDRDLTLTQLNKYLFGIDFLNHKKYGSSLTNSEYARLPYGPVLSDYESVFFGFSEQKLVKCHESIYKDNIVYRFSAIEKPDTSIFTREELETIQYIKKQFKNKNAKDLSTWSHEFKGWLFTPTGKFINYNFSKDLNV